MAVPPGAMFIRRRSSWRGGSAAAWRRAAASADGLARYASAAVRRAAGSAAKPSLMARRTLRRSAAGRARRQIVSSRERAAPEASPRSESRAAASAWARATPVTSPGGGAGEGAALVRDAGPEAVQPGALRCARCHLPTPRVVCFENGPPAGCCQPGRCECPKNPGMNPRLLAGPLSGAVILDLSRILAGPYCTLLLQ